MRKFERRATGKTTYFKLATFDARSCTFRDGRTAYESETDAASAAKRPGTYRVSVVDQNGRRDLEPFIIA